jgi:hypothetical protein
VGDRAEVAATLIARLMLFHLALAQVNGRSAAESLTSNLTALNATIYCA